MTILKKKQFTPYRRISSIIEINPDNTLGWADTLDTHIHAPSSTGRPLEAAYRKVGTLRSRKLVGMSVTGVDDEVGDEVGDEVRMPITEVGNDVGDVV